MMKAYLNFRNYILIGTFLLAGLLFTSCDTEKVILPTEDIDKETLAINEWILDYMDLAYFWNQELPNIDTKLEQDSEKYFEKLLKKPDDKWSFITDDAKALFNYFDGIIKSMGYSIQLYYLEEGSDQVISIVEYVYPNSPASIAGIERGDIFTRINGTTITDKNYQNLLNLDEMSITLASLTNEGIIEQPSTLNLIAIELNTNPVIVKSILDAENIKIGYLAYTSFIEKYDSTLIQAFSDFKQAGVTELVLDLRYNGGGSVTSAQLLAGLIAPTSAVGEVFISEVWNKNLTKYNEKLKIKQHNENLNLSRVYILTTEGTASASEMVIYGLEPHMEVIQIGDETYGKYYGSITITADERKKHNWAIQPIVMRAENKTNSINYSSGLSPNYRMVDNVYNAQLGDPEEIFLAAAISHITKGSFPTPSTLKSKRNRNTVKRFKEWIEPHRATMIVKKREVE